MDKADGVRFIAESNLRGSIIVRSTSIAMLDVARAKSRLWIENPLERVFRVSLLGRFFKVETR